MECPNSQSDLRLRRWMLLPASQAHVSWLPHGVRPVSERALRIASKSLLTPPPRLPQKDAKEWKLIAWLMHDDAEIASSLRRMTGLLFRPGIRKLVTKQERQCVQNALGDSIFQEVWNADIAGTPHFPQHQLPDWENNEEVLRPGFLVIHSVLASYAPFLAQRLLIRFPRQPWTTWCQQTDPAFGGKLHAKLVFRAMHLSSEDALC